MDITVTIPDAKAQLVIDALNARPGFHGWTFLAADATNPQKRIALTTYYQTRWKDELRTTVRQHRRQVAVDATVAADDALPDPLA